MRWESALSAAVLLLSLGTAAFGKKRPLVLVCYDEGDRHLTESCDHIRDYVNDPKRCENAEAVEVTPRSPTPGQITEFLQKKKLPANTLTIVTGHQSVDRTNPDIHRLDLGKNESVKTSDVLDAIGGAKGALTEPRFWLAACGSGLACGKGYCLGASCQAGEDTYTLPDTSYTDKATLALLELFCRKENFDRVSKKTPTITGAQFGEYLQCRPDALDFDTVSIAKHAVTEAKIASLKEKQQGNLLRLLNQAFLEEVVSAYFKAKGKKTDIEYRLDDVFEPSYAERAREAYAAYLAAGGMPNRADQQKRIHDELDKDEAPFKSGYIKSTDQAFQVLWQKVTFEAPKPNGNFVDYRTTYPWRPLKACVRGESSVTKFTFRPQVAEFQFSFYPDATFEPKPDLPTAPSGKDKESGKGRTH